ncbi:MAG: DUF2490 domain-containing protein [Bacteroidales bacterium]|nr:DUF2490 domain-containing protein [Bacteroidales bacterium]
MNNIIKNIILSILVITCITVKIDAQEIKVISDLEQWTSIGLSKKINKHWKISLDQEFRFTKNASQFDIYLADLAVDYRFNKHFAAGANYRFYQNKNKDGVFKTQHRWNTDFQYKYKISRFSIAYRLRFQNKDEDFFTNESDNNLYNLRNKLSVNYNIKNFKPDPYFDIELFRRLEKGEDSYFNKMRWTLGIEYPITKKTDIELFYRIDNELNESYAKDTYIIGLGYKISF